MKGRIYLNVLGLLLLCVLILLVSVSCIFYNVTKNGEIAAIKDRAVLIADLLNRGINEEYINKDYYDNSEYNSPFADFISDESDTARMTIIAPNGTVLLDNKTLASTLENHGDREEFIQALETGSGESTRYSDTFGTESFYII